VLRKINRTEHRPEAGPFPGNDHRGRFAGGLRGFAADRRVEDFRFGRRVETSASMARISRRSRRHNGSVTV
jgi:hypothetical protein